MNVNVWNENGTLNHARLHELEQYVLSLRNKRYYHLNEDKNERGYIPLCVDKTMPSDCFYYYVVKPTVIICAKLMEIDEGCYGDTITKALNVLFERLFAGHGYDDESECADNLAILLENGLLDYINKEQYEIWF